ncbi:MAG: hypothetical protein IJ306_01080 [Oscillospiraceae bacterium]|nr:hypothetical protein [Oscillospiraceae bacterium]
MRWEDNPCNGCTEETGRKQGCHGKCRKRKIWSILNELRKNEEKREIESKKAILSPAYVRIHRNVLKRKLEGRK